MIAKSKAEKEEGEEEEIIESEEGKRRNDGNEIVVLCRNHKGRLFTYLIDIIDCLPEEILYPPKV